MLVSCWDPADQHGDGVFGSGALVVAVGYIRQQGAGQPALEPRDFRSGVGSHFLEQGQCPVVWGPCLLGHGRHGVNYGLLSSPGW